MNSSSETDEEKDDDVNRPFLSRPVTVRKRSRASRPPPPPPAPLVLVLPPGSPDFPFPVYEEEGLVCTRRLVPLPSPHAAEEDSSPDLHRRRRPSGESSSIGSSSSSSSSGENYALIEITDACACTTRDGLAVVPTQRRPNGDDDDDDVAIVCRDETSRMGHAAFRLPSYDSSDSSSSRTLLMWLLCSHFKFNTFRTRVVRGVGLERKLVEATDELFSRGAPRRTREGREPKASDCRCIEYRLKKNADVVFFLKKCVVAGNRKGPTIESVMDGLS